MQWTPKGIQMWNWAHDAAPRDIETRAPAPNTWGTPNFNTQGAGNECDIERLFGEQWLVFNTVFCGDAAAADTYWHQTSCYKKGHMTCADYVAKHPAAFTDVYWLINSVNIYLPAGLTPPSIKPRGAALPEHAEEIRTAPSWE